MCRHACRSWETSSTCSYIFHVHDVERRTVDIDSFINKYHYCFWNNFNSERNASRPICLHIRFPFDFLLNDFSRGTYASPCIIRQSGMANTSPATCQCLATFTPLKSKVLIFFVTSFVCSLDFLIDRATQKVPIPNIWKKLSVQFLRYTPLNC